MESRYWRLEEQEIGPMLVDTMLEVRSIEIAGRKHDSDQPFMTKSHRGPSQ